jgi:thiamine-phosphate pyrophosphorylase
MMPSDEQRPAVGRLHVLTDISIQRIYSHAELARLAFRGGADVVQLREKDRLALNACLLGEFLSVPRQPGQMLLVNDYVEMAQGTDWDGVHVGAQDLPPGQARARLGPQKLLGVTVHSLAELDALRQLPPQTVDYLGVGPVFGTQSKDTGLPPLGCLGLEAICSRSPWPVIAIGGITGHNMADVLAAGAYGVAVLGAVATAADPEAATRQLRDALRKVLG